MPNNLENHERFTENYNVNTSQNSFPDPLVGDTQCQIHTIVLYDILKKQKQKETENENKNENENYLNNCKLLTFAKSPQIDKNGKIFSEKLHIEKIPEKIIKKLEKPGNRKISNRDKRGLFSKAKQSISEKEFKFLEEYYKNLNNEHLMKYFLEEKNLIYLKSDRIHLNVLPCYLSFHFFLNYLIKENALLIIHLTRFLGKITKASEEPKVSVEPNGPEDFSLYKEFTLFYRYKKSFFSLLEETSELKNEMAIVIAIHSDLINELPEITNSCFYESDPEKFITRFKEINIYRLLGVIGAAHRQIPRSAQGKGVDECSKIFNQEKIFEISDRKFNNAEYDKDAYFKKQGGFEGTIESFHRNLIVAYKYGIFRLNPEKQNEEIKIKKETCLHAKHIYLATGNTINPAY